MIFKLITSAATWIKNKVVQFWYGDTENEQEQSPLTEHATAPFKKMFSHNLYEGLTSLTTTAGSVTGLYQIMALILSCTEETFPGCQVDIHKWSNYIAIMAVLADIILQFITKDPYLSQYKPIKLMKSALNNTRDISGNLAFNIEFIAAIHTAITQAITHEEDITVSEGVFFGTEFLPALVLALVGNTDLRYALAGDNPNEIRHWQTKTMDIFSEMLKGFASGRALVVSILSLINAIFKDVLSLDAALSRGLRYGIGGLYAIIEGFVHYYYAPGKNSYAQTAQKFISFLAFFIATALSVKDTEAHDRTWQIAGFAGLAALEIVAVGWLSRRQYQQQSAAELIATHGTFRVMVNEATFPDDDDSLSTYLSRRCG